MEILPQGNSVTNLNIWPEEVFIHRFSVVVDFVQHIDNSHTTINKIVSRVINTILLKNANDFPDKFYYSLRNRDTA